MACNKLSDRLKGMLLETTDDTNNAPLLSRPLIEVVSNNAEEARGRSSSVSNSEKKQVTTSLGLKSRIDDDDESDDGPPPISFNGAISTKPKSPAVSNEAPSSGAHHHRSTNNSSMSSLAEQMLADATKAKQKQQRQNTQKEQRRAKKSTFGLKKGFLNSLSNDKKTGKKSSGSRSRADDISKLEGDDGNVQHGEESNLIYELDNDGNMIPSSSAASSSSTTNSEQGTKANPLHLPEVQSAMLSHLQSNSSEWATSDLLDSVPRDHPKLAQGMNDPRYMKALQDMQTNPKETLERLKKSDPEIVEWLKKFCGVMGEHFCRLGDGQQKLEKKKKKGEEGVSSTATTTVEDKKVKEMGPLEKKALNRHKKTQKSKDSTKHSEERQSDLPTQNGMDNQVASILANGELRSILLDPKMQQIMEECTGQDGGGGGSKFRYYIGHEEYGPKLRKLMEAGLIRLA